MPGDRDCPLLTVPWCLARGLEPRRSAQTRCTGPDPDRAMSRVVTWDKGAVVTKGVWPTLQRALGRGREGDRLDASKHKLWPQVDVSSDLSSELWESFLILNPSLSSFKKCCHTINITFTT